MKSNISIVKDYLAGIRPVSIFGYTPSEIKRKIGDVWEDSKGITWKQENGFKTRVNKQADVIREARKETCKLCHQDIRWGSRADHLFFRKTGLCEGCLIDYETKLHVLGIYPDYEKYKLASNELGATKDLKEKIKGTIKYFSGNDTDVTMLCNSEGFVERWKTTNKDQILSDAEKDLKEARHRIEALTKICDEFKKKYESTAAKFNLEILCQTEKSAIKS